MTASDKQILKYILKHISHTKEKKRKSIGTAILEWKNTSDVDNVLEISHGQFQLTCSQTDLKYIF